MSIDFNSLSDQEKRKFAEMMFTPLDSSTEIKDWAMTFLGLDIPLEITDPDSTSSPLDAIWQIYNTFKHNSGNKNPGYILMSCREGMKTISVAILETLLLLHFQLDIGHAAATEDQSSVGLGYIEGFVLKISPLIEAAGWISTTQNKRLFKYKTPQGKQPFIKIVICNSKGMNSLHSNVLFLDELDLADPKALKEGTNIVGYSKGIHGIKVYLSTRKYAFGNMAAAIENAPKMRYKVLNWNIIDVTENCPPERHKPDGVKEDRYVAKSLPLKQISKEEFGSLPDVEKLKFDLVKNAHEGCKNCDLLPVCKMRLAEKPTTAAGGFYKPIDSIIQKFAENSPDIAESQLMCWAPGTEGLVYPRFSISGNNSNVISIKKAWETLLGPTDKKQISKLDLIEAMKNSGVGFYAGVDWGYTHDSVILIAALIPNGEVWIVDCYAAPGLEFSDILEIAMAYRDQYKINKWFVDQIMPSNMKSFNKNGMKCPTFTKDVMGGIEAVRAKLLTASGKRLLKVLDVEENRKVISAIIKHRFKIDGQGNVTLEPDDARGIADICDSLRYIGQNLFPVRGSFKPKMVMTEEIKPESKNPVAEEQMRQEIYNRVSDSAIPVTSSRKGGFHFTY